MKKYFFTQKGLETLQVELSTLLLDRKKAVIELKTARELGDLSENGFYKSARFKLSGIDRRLRQLKTMISNAHIILPSQSAHITMGDTVTIINDKSEKTFTIVGNIEANPSKNSISNVSPLGKAMLGKSLHNLITIKTPSGVLTYTITKIEKLQ